MNNICKAAKLDFILLKYYLKSICFTLFIPLVFVLLYRTLVVGISFAMFMISMTSIYSFSVADKNDMKRLYAILPVSVSELVWGKYLHVSLMGMAALVISSILQPLILAALGISVTFMDAASATAVGLVLFVTYICFQIPGYYKFGPIKGRVFMYVPVAGILFTVFVAGKLNFNSSYFLHIFDRYRFLLPCLVIAYLVLIVFISVRISIKIAENKE